MIHHFKGDFNWLSNFYPSTVTFEGQRYRTVEHAYQAAKTLDPVVRQSIQEAHYPGEAKRRGRMAVLRPGWDELKLGIMKDLLQQKFTNPALRERLVATGDEWLQEGNWWGDTFWGVDDKTNQGQNHLGRLLMEIRHAASSPSY